MIKSNKVSGLRKVIINLRKTLNGNVEFATSQSFIYEGKNQKCTLSEAQIKASIPIVVGAAHTIDTILKISEWSGFPIRDIYPLTRCVIESLINDSFIMAENESVAMKALRYGIFADYKYSNREVGSGKFKLKITSSNILDSSELKKLFAEFKGNKSWTDLDLPSRIGVIGEKGFEPSSQNFLGSYAFVYSISSDIIHGSPYGFKYFISAYRNRGENITEDEFFEATEKQLEWIFISLILAICAYLCVFSKINNMDKATNLAEELATNVLKDAVKQQ